MDYPSGRASDRVELADAFQRGVGFREEHLVARDLSAFTLFIYVRTTCILFMYVRTPFILFMYLRTALFTAVFFLFVHLHTALERDG